MEVKRYFGACEYIGTSFFGWQSQGTENATVAGLIEFGIKHILAKPIKQGNIEFVELKGSSRTDTGVHAIYNTFHIDFKRNPQFGMIPPENLLIGLNRSFEKNNAGIKILEMREVPLDFHARFSAVSREYIYKLFIGPESVFLLEFYWILEELNINKLEEALGIFENKISLNDICKVKQEKYEDDQVKIDAWMDIKENEILLHFRSTKFFWHQIRYMVGALVDFSCGKISLKQLNSFFSGTAGKKPSRAPAAGLYLAKVEYV
ncbi:unnamed protein product [Blepharisma stoltei]|uniref:tRNA pseudouridine synthase n=1 Tax=Blepharisma stoltei TaxID=1481888 RepID=A0AAU9JEQ3_9CILI|nr:unnamed protein product [Blepharisma stoltei]